MSTGPNIAAASALMGDPARACMVASLMSGQALTAGELAYVAGIAASTASCHLKQLLAGGLLTLEQQGRYRYYRLAGPEIAEAVEALMVLVESLPLRRVHPGPRDAAMRRARMCYDHLAGEYAVAAFARLTQRSFIAFKDGTVDLTPSGEEAFMRLGIDLAAIKSKKRPLCRACLDWSERRLHLAGALGAAFIERMFELGWAHRVAGSRIVLFTSQGQARFAKLFEG